MLVTIKTRKRLEAGWKLEWLIPTRLSGLWKSSRCQESLAQRQVDQWQDGYPDEEIIFEDILESRGYVAVENQEVVAYAAVHKEMKRPIMGFMMASGSMTIICMSLFTVSL